MQLRSMLGLLVEAGEHLFLTSCILRGCCFSDLRPLASDLILKARAGHLLSLFAPPAYLLQEPPHPQLTQWFGFIFDVPLAIQKDSFVG